MDVKSSLSAVGLNGLMVLSSEFLLIILALCLGAIKNRVRGKAH